MEETNEMTDTTIESNYVTELEALKQELSDEKGKSEKYLVNWQKSQAVCDTFK